VVSSDIARSINLPTYINNNNNNTDGLFRLQVFTSSAASSPNFSTFILAGSLWLSFFTYRNILTRIFLFLVIEFWSVTRSFTDERVILRSPEVDSDHALVEASLVNSYKKVFLAASAPHSGDGFVLWSETWRWSGEDLQSDCVWALIFVFRMNAVCPSASVSFDLMALYKFYYYFFNPRYT